MEAHTDRELACLSAHAQAAMRGVKQAAMTQPEADDPLKEMYGDLEMVQSKTSATKAFTRVEDLEPSLAGQQVGSCNKAHGLWVIPKPAQQLHSRLQPKPQHTTHSAVGIVSTPRGGIAVQPRVMSRVAGARACWSSNRVEYEGICYSAWLVV